MSSETTTPFTAYQRALVELEALALDLRGVPVLETYLEQAKVRLQVAQEFISLGDSLLAVIAVSKQRDESS